MKRSSGIIVTGLSASLLSTGALVGSGLLGADDASTATVAATATVGLASPSTGSSASADPTTAAEPGAAATSEAPPEASSAATGTYDGEAVTSRYGAFQAEITVADGVITDIAWLQAGESDQHSQRINAQAIPMLEQAILEAQSSDVGYISGASYTSAAVKDAVLSAMRVAGLA